jgi:MFS family permease
MTKEQKWLSRRYLAYQALTNVWFLGAVWIYFYRLFITDQQIGVLDAMAFAIGLIAEVPSGALADKFGRDKMVRLGQALTGCGLLIQVAGSSFMPFFVGQAVMMIGVSFVSGADEALFFEKLNFKRTSAAWRKLLTRGTQAALVASLAATVLGGWLHTINPRIPWILTGISFLLTVLLIWPIKDTRTKSVRQRFLPEVKDYLQDIKTGFAQFRLPKLWLYVPIIITVQGLFYATDFGVLRLMLLSRFHFDPFWGSIVVASSGLITVGILALTHKYADSLSERHVVVMISLSAATGLLLSLANIGMWGYIVILVLYAGEHVLYPLMSEVLNKHAPEKQRATVLSVASFLKTLPYVILAPIIGWLNTHGKLNYFLLIWAIFVCAAVALYVFARKRDEQVVVQDGLLEVSGGKSHLSIEG